MPTKSGFGKPQPQPKVSKRSQERAKASKEYDKMKADGLPEYEIYIRIQDKKQWFPVGVVSVQRSSQINAAIFDSQEQLLQGAFRIFPILKKNQTQLEYGYRLKEFKDEPIQVAVKPESGAKGAVQGAIEGIKDRVAALLKRK